MVGNSHCQGSVPHSHPFWSEPWCPSVSCSCVCQMHQSHQSSSHVLGSDYPGIWNIPHVHKIECTQEHHMLSILKCAQEHIYREF